MAEKTAKSSNVKIIIAVVAVVAVVAGIKIFTRPAQTAAVEEAALVETATVKRTALMQQGFSTTSTLTALEEVELIPKVSARVKTVRVKKGDRVAKGQVLVEFDAGDQTAQVASARAQISVNQAAADQSKAQLDDARREYERYGRLKKEGYATQQEYDTRLTSLKSAEADYAKNLASVSQARAQLQQQTANLADYTLKSPLNGAVMDDYDLATGAFLSAGANAMRLARIDVLKALVDIPEESMKGIKKGMEGQVTCDSLADHGFTGKVSMINPYVNTDTRTVRVEISIDNKAANYMLKPGMFARVLFVQKSAANALSIPTEAIRKDGSVFAVRNGKAESVKISTGVVQDNNTQVTFGLNEGDKVITSGGDSLKNMAPVTEQKN